MRSPVPEKVWTLFLEVYAVYKFNDCGLSITADTRIFSVNFKEKCKHNGKVTLKGVQQCQKYLSVSKSSPSDSKLSRILKLNCYH